MADGNGRKLTTEREMTIQGCPSVQFKKKVLDCDEHLQSLSGIRLGSPDYFPVHAGRCASVISLIRLE